MLYPCVPVRFSWAVELYGAGGGNCISRELPDSDAARASLRDAEGSTRATPAVRSRRAARASRTSRIAAGQSNSLRRPGGPSQARQSSR